MAITPTLNKQNPTLGIIACFCQSMMPTVLQDNNSAIIYKKTYAQALFYK